MYDDDDDNDDDGGGGGGDGGDDDANELISTNRQDPHLKPIYSCLQ